MFNINIGGKDYKIKFSINAVAETDLIDQVKAIFTQINSSDGGGIEAIKDLAVCVRGLLYAGSQKYNPIESEQDAGDLLDDYIDEQKEAGEKDIVMKLFMQMAEDLSDEGFLGDLLETMMNSGKKQAKKKAVK